MDEADTYCYDTVQSAYGTSGLTVSDSQNVWLGFMCETCLERRGASFTRLLKKQAQRFFFFFFKLNRFTNYEMTVLIMA